MNLKNKEIDHNDQSCSHKETQTISDPNNLSDIKDNNITSYDQRARLPLPRDFIKINDDSIKIFKSCEIFKNSCSSETITIVREITEEIFNDKLENDGVSGGKYKYCREVIRPFLKTAPLDCPDDEELLAKEGLYSAPDEIPDLQPCVDDQYVGCSKVEGIDKNKINVGSSTKTPKDDQERHDGSYKESKECRRKSENSSKKYYNIKIKDCLFKQHKENLNKCDTAENLKDKKYNDSSTEKNIEVMKKVPSSTEENKNDIKRDDCPTKHIIKYVNKVDSSTGTPENIIFKERGSSEKRISEKSSLTPYIKHQEDFSSQTELLICDDVTKSNSQSKPVQALDKSDTTYPNATGNLKYNEMGSVSNDCDQNDQGEYSDKDTAKTVTCAKFDNCTNEGLTAIGSFSICQYDELKQKIVLNDEGSSTDDSNEKMSQDCKNQNTSDIIGSRQCYKTTVCTTITSTACPVYTKEYPKVCNSNKSMESENNFDNPIISAENGQSSNSSVVSANSGCDSPKKTIRDSGAEPKCNKYKIPETEREPCFPEKDRSLITILKNKICPKCSQESTPCQLKESKPCLPKNQLPCFPKEPEPSHPKDFDRCPNKKIEPFSPRDPGPCPNREPNPCPQKEPCLCRTKEYFHCSPRDPIPFSLKEAGGFFGWLSNYISSKLFNKTPKTTDSFPLKEHVCPVHTEKEPEPCSSNKSVESESNFGSPIISADSGQCSIDSVVSPDRGCDSPKSKVDKSDSGTKSKCNKYKLPESERKPCFPEKDQSVITILRKKICPACSQESMPYQSKETDPCIPKDFEPFPPGKPTPCPLEDTNPCPPIKPKPCPPKEPDPCPPSEPDPCPPRERDPCPPREPDPCPPRERDPCPPREPDTYLPRELDPCPPREPDPCPYGEPNPCRSKEPVSCLKKESFPCPTREPIPCRLKEGGFCGWLCSFISSKVSNNMPQKTELCSTKNYPCSSKEGPEDADPKNTDDERDSGTKGKCNKYKLSESERKPCFPEKDRSLITILTKKICPDCAQELPNCQSKESEPHLPRKLPPCYPKEPDRFSPMDFDPCPPRKPKPCPSREPDSCPPREPNPCLPREPCERSNICTFDSEASFTKESESSSTCLTKPCTPSQNAFDDFGTNLIKSHQRTMATLFYVAEDLMSKVTEKTKEVTQNPQAMQKAKCAADEIITECDKLVRQKAKELCDIAKASEIEQKAKNVVTSICETTNEIYTKTTEACKKKIGESKKWLSSDDDEGHKKPRNTCSCMIPGRHTGITCDTNDQNTDDDDDDNDNDDNVFSNLSSKVGHTMSSVTPNFGNMIFNYNDDESSPYDKPSCPSDCPKDINMMFSEIGALLNEPQVFLNSISAIKETVDSMFYDTKIPEPAPSVISDLMENSPSLKENNSKVESDEEDSE